MAYIALLEEKLRPALVAPPVLCCFPDKHYYVLITFIVLSCVVTHFLGGCRKLLQSDATVVCVTLAIPAQLSRPKSPRQHRPLSHPPYQRRGAVTQNL